MEPMRDGTPGARPPDRLSRFRTRPLDERDENPTTSAPAPRIALRLAARPVWKQFLELQLLRIDRICFGEHLHEVLAAGATQGCADGCDRLARVPAVLREQQAGERQGLRERGRVRGREAARVRSGEVNWVVEPFDSSYAPGPKSFDFDINEISITPARAKARRLLARPTTRTRRRSSSLKGSHVAHATSRSRH